MNVQFVRYLFVGGFNTLIGYAIIFVLIYFCGVGPLISNVIGYSVCLVISFFLNKRITFESSADARSEIIPFLAVFVVSYLLNFCVVLIFSYVKVTNAWLAQLMGGGVYVFCSFVLNKLYVFRRRNDGGV